MSVQLDDLRDIALRRIRNLADDLELDGLNVGYTVSVGCDRINVEVRITGRAITGDDTDTNE